MPDWLRSWLREERKAWGFAVAVIVTWFALRQI